MDKMPSLSSEWIRALAGGVVALLLARYLRFGWILGLAVSFLFFFLSSDWFVGRLAESALMEDPTTTRLAQAAVAVPILGAVLGYWWRRRVPRKAPPGEVIQM